jgi:hypothetical protein
MEALKRKKGLLVFISLFLLMGGLTFIPAESVAQATTQGDVALKMAGMLGFEVATAEDAAAVLQAKGIVPSGGWNLSAPATPAFIGNLYTAVDNAVGQGKVTLPAALGNASALVSAAATAAGMPSAVVVNAVVQAGGDRASAIQGATYGTTLAAAPGAPAAPISPVTPLTPPGPCGRVPGGGVTSPSL